MEFTTEAIFQALKGPLAVVDSPERRGHIEGYIEAVRLPLEQSVFDLLARLSESVSREVSPHYQVSLRYRPGLLDLDVRPAEPSETAGETWTLAEGEVEKITLRIPAELKDLAAQAAAKAGLSVNSWFVRVLARALRSAEASGPEPPEDGPSFGASGRRLTGWVG